MTADRAHDRKLKHQIETLKGDKSKDKTWKYKISFSLDDTKERREDKSKKSGLWHPSNSNTHYFDLSPGYHQINTRSSDKGIDERIHPALEWH